jgi:hypothetical protein
MVVKAHVRVRTMAAAKEGLTCVGPVKAPSILLRSDDGEVVSAVHSSGSPGERACGVPVAFPALRGNEGGEDSVAPSSRPWNDPEGYVALAAFGTVVEAGDVSGTVNVEEAWP